MKNFNLIFLLFFASLSIDCNSQSSAPAESQDGTSLKCGSQLAKILESMRLVQGLNYVCSTERSSKIYCVVEPGKSNQYIVRNSKNKECALMANSKSRTNSPNQPKPTCPKNQFMNCETIVGYCFCELK